MSETTEDMIKKAPTGEVEAADDNVTDGEAGGVAEDTQREDQGA